MYFSLPLKVLPLYFLTALPTLALASVLRADIHIADQIPVVPAQPLPFGTPATWSHMASTLISGEKEAVLVDPPLTINQTAELAAWIKAVFPDKILTTIFITHGHGDHFFGISSMLRHFPHARVVATAQVIEHMREQITPQVFDAVWDPIFPKQLEKPDVNVVHPLPQNNTFELEGHKLHAVQAGFSDTYNSTFLHIPALSMVVAGDVCYNEEHQYLVEAKTDEIRRAWIAGLQHILDLNPGTVIASHKRPGAVDGINNVHATITYIKAFGELRSQSKNAAELYQKMIRRYPHRVNPFILWLGCQAQFEA